MSRKYLHSLEGVRAYAFLWVFTVHYTFGLTPVPRDGRFLLRVWCLLNQVSWTAVPIFFVLSGFLITGVLFDTRGLGGFFRTFYARRALRVLPLYYLLLLCAGVYAFLSGLTFSRFHLLYLVYLHNFVREWPKMYHVGNYVDLGHLWSLAIEEQFYLIWPVVIFLVRGRRSLLGCCYGVIVVVSVLRVLWPLTHMTYVFAYECSLTRCDALMMGAALALHRRGPMQGLARLVTPAKVVGIGGVALLLIRALLVGQALPHDYIGLALLTPVVNLIAAAVIVLVIQPETVLSRLCSKNWAVKMGSMSYSLYVVHEPLAPWFQGVLLPYLKGRLHCGNTALLPEIALAFALTYAVAWLTYHGIEMPALRMKDRIRYGLPRVRRHSVTVTTGDRTGPRESRAVA